MSSSSQQNVNGTSLMVQKMVFIYNALLTGWTVRMIGPDQFEFVKPTTNIKREVNLDDYLRKFIQYNLNIENALK